MGGALSVLILGSGADKGGGMGGESFRDGDGETK
jgi:hypothetical protein